jgi:hypothetical protein
VDEQININQIHLATNSIEYLKWIVAGKILVSILNDAVSMNDFIINLKYQITHVLLAKKRDDNYLVQTNYDWKRLFSLHRPRNISFFTHKQNDLISLSIILTVANEAIQDYFEKK